MQRRNRASLAVTLMGDVLFTSSAFGMGRSVLGVRAADSANCRRPDQPTEYRERETSGKISGHTGEFPLLIGDVSADILTDPFSRDGTRMNAQTLSDLFS